MSARQVHAIASWVLVSTLVVPRVVSAQDRESSGVGHALKVTFLDPTTYAPGLLTYDATMRDWNTSQPFFRNGFLERNARFTISGFSNDKPVSYDTGRRQILTDSLSVLAVSAVHNFSERVVEGAVGDSHPNHRRLVAALGWVERSAVASLMSYELSGPHYRQWRRNQQLSAQLGIR
jgi:hypothetical protein